MASFNSIPPRNLMRLICTPDAPAIIDVRIPEDRALHPEVIPGSILQSHQHIDSLQDQLADRTCVVICHKGLKLSHGVAALLRDRGINAEVLEGGFLAWEEADLPRIPIDALPTTTPSLWVTRHRPKIDRIACPWLIRRFIDANARILFVPPAEVTDVAARFDATPFDVPGVPLSHHGGQCSFDAFVATYHLQHTALDRLATVVRAADTGDHAASPQAAGLLAVSVGLSRLYRDDTAQLAAGMTLYDALYRWARDGFDEDHRE